VKISAIKHPAGLDDDYEEEYRRLGRPARATQTFVLGNTSRTDR
jgi:hypothetical protein